MNGTYDYRSCESLFGYAASAHIRSGGICQLCGCGDGKRVDFDLWRQMTVEHLIGESQGGYLHQIKKTLLKRFPELSSDKLEELSKRIDELNTVTACSFCNSSTSRNQHEISMTELIDNTEGAPDVLTESVKNELDEILKKKRSIIQWKLSSIRKAFEKEIRPVLEQARHGVQTNESMVAQKHEYSEHIPHGKDKIMMEFVDDEEGYLKWLQENPSGFVVNCDRTPNSEYLILHRANCGTIMHATRGPGNWTTGDYIKVCSLKVSELNEWAEKEIGGQPEPCQRCKP